MKTLLSQAELLGVPISDDTTIDNADERIMEIRKEIQKKFQDRATIRNNELLEAANVATNSGEKEKLKALCRLRKIEHKIKVFERLNFQRGKDMQSSGIDCLEVPVSWPTLEDNNESVEYTLEDTKLIPKEDDDKWKTVTCPNEIEFYLKLRNC